MDENILKFRGYKGTIKYSQLDKCFYVKIDNISDLVLLEADNLEDLEENFKNIVDEYISTRKKIKKKDHLNT